MINKTSNLCYPDENMFHAFSASNFVKYEYVGPRKAYCIVESFN